MTLCVCSREPAEGVGEGRSEEPNRKTAGSHTTAAVAESVGVVWCVCCTLLVNVYSKRHLYTRCNVHLTGWFG